MLLLQANPADTAHLDVWAVGSAIAAIASAIIAFSESRARTKDAKRYAEALDSVIKAAQYVKHLEGMETRMVSLNSQFEKLGEIIFRVSDHIKNVAQSTQDMVDLAGKHIVQSVANLEKATASVDDISKSLSEIAASSRRSERDSLKAHGDLMKDLRRGEARGTVTVDPALQEGQEPSRTKDRKS